jgi:hypothetical protein
MVFCEMMFLLWIQVPQPTTTKAVTKMRRPLGTVVLAASVLAAALALPVTGHAKDAAMNVAAADAAAPAATARAQLATPKVKRVRKPLRRVAAVAAPSSYHPQCFLFWCTAGGRSYNLLMLGVAY